MSKFTDGLSTTVILVLGVAGQAMAAQSASRVDPDGTVHVRAFDLPLSSFLSPESQAIVKRMTAEHDDLMQHFIALASPRFAHTNLPASMQ